MKRSRRRLPLHKSKPKTDKTSWWEHCHGHLKIVNDSKVFAGIMIILLNVSTKFVPIRVSKSMEAFLRYTFSRNILVFAICWVGTRDIIISLCITLIFILLIDYLLNEDSKFCILPESFVDHHINLAAQNDSKTPVNGGQTAPVNGGQTAPVVST
jgi:hypothetical protein